MADIPSRFKLRRGTAAQWSVNPVLAAGEPGWETDTKKLRIGDGVTPFLSLPYYDDSTAFATTAQGTKADNAMPANVSTAASDYQTIDTSKSGHFNAGPAAANRPLDETCAIRYHYIDATAGFLEATSITSGRRFIMRRSGSAWGSWVELTRTTDVVQRVTGGYAGTADALGDLAAGNYVHLLGAAATGFWTLASTNDHVITLTGGPGVAAQQIGFDKDGKVFYRGRSGATWNTDGWKELISDVTIGALVVPGAQINYESSGAPSSFPTGAYGALPLNIIKNNSLGLTLTANQIKFTVAGTYYIEAVITARNASGGGRSAAVRLYNATAVAEEVLGTGFNNGNAGVATCHIAGRFTVAANDLIEIQGIASGSGVQVGDETDYNNPNVYSIVKLWKVS